MENNYTDKSLPFLTRFFRAIAQDLVVPRVCIPKKIYDNDDMLSGRTGEGNEGRETNR